MKIINPATEEIIKDVDVDSRERLEKKFSLLRASRMMWKNIPVSQRAEVLSRFAALLHAERETLALVLTRETGKPIQQSHNEINSARTRIKWLVANAEKYLSPETMFQDDAMQEQIVYDPLGVICNISAWNYPYLVGVNVFAAALLAGNAVMYKPSEHATLTGLEIERLLKKAGVPDDVFHVAVGASETGSTLLDFPFDGFFFTGSYKTGRHIYEKVASRMVPCQCELGGKDPLYVADDISDIRHVAAATADGAFYNNGQSCCAVERIYVHENVYDRYVDEFVSEVNGFTTGDPETEGTYFGPLARGEQIKVLEEQISDALSKGAKVLTGGKRMNRSGYYFEPTVLVDTTHDMRIMREESFGPVIGIMRVLSDREAIELMNDTAYGLTASVYSSNEERARRILDELNTGTGYWNCCDRVSPALPWGGRKHSGLGVTLSHVGIRAFTRPRGMHLKKC